MYKDTSPHGESNAFDLIVSALAANGSQRKGHDWQCPAHDDRTPSLTVKQGTGKVLVCCHAGCDTGTVVKSLGLDMRDLFDKPRAGQASAIRQQVSALSVYALARPWQGRTKERDRDVYVAVLRRGYAANTMKPNYSLRALGLDTCTGYVSAGRALHKLSGELGLLHLGAEPGDGRARTITIVRVRENETRTYEDLPFLRNPYVPLSRTLDSSTAELYTLLTKKGVAVLSALTDEPASARKIAGQAKVSDQTARAKLKGVLSALGYAVDTGKGWVRGPALTTAYDPETDSMCGPILANRRETYERHRRDHKEYIARREGKKRPGNLVCMSCGQVLTDADQCPACYPEPVKEACKNCGKPEPYPMMAPFCITGTCYKCWAIQRDAG